MVWSAGNPPPVFTNTQVINQLFPVDGPWWQTATITYSLAGLTAAQQPKAIIAFSLWDELIAKSITSGGSQITFSNASGVGYAYTNSAWSEPSKAMTSGQVFFDIAYNGAGGDADNDLMHPGIGLHGFATFIHEIGHAFGLDHMGTYDGSADATLNASSFQDSTVYSIMSYFGPSWGPGAAKGEGIVAWADWVATDGLRYDPQTPMLNDILAMQTKYGADTTTRTGNTVYGFNSTLAGVDGDIFNFSVNAHPILCIYDAGGNDTLNLSGYSLASNIDLNPGAFSDCNDMTKNISIAWSATIENAVGGSGNDTIKGNSVDNILKGGAGLDTLDGGSGTDTADYSDKALSVSVTLNGATAATVNVNGIAEDSIKNIENLIGGGGGDTLGGDGLSNRLDGGLGNDTLIGGAGADALIGGGGTDTAYYYGSAVGVTVNLLAGTGVGGDAQGDTLSGIEQVIGSNIGGDTLTGDSGVNYLAGFGGDDTMDGGEAFDSLSGGAGIDTVAYGSATTGVQVILDFYASNTGVSWDGTSGDLIVDFENIMGSAQRDILSGDAGANVINGGLGNDTLFGKGGADTFRFTTPNFGYDVIADFVDGIDKLSFSTNVATSINDFTIYGNGSTIMSVVYNADPTQVAVVIGSAPITLTASDFVFV